MLQIAAKSSSEDISQNLSVDRLGTILHTLYYIPYITYPILLCCYSGLAALLPLSSVCVMIGMKSPLPLGLHSYEQPKRCLQTMFLDGNVGFVCVFALIASVYVCANHRVSETLENHLWHQTN